MKAKSSKENILQSKCWIPYSIICFGDEIEVSNKLDHNLMRFLSVKTVQFVTEHYLNSSIYS